MLGNPLRIHSLVQSAGTTITYTNIEVAAAAGKSQGGLTLIGTWSVLTNVMESQTRQGAMTHDYTGKKRRYMTLGVDKHDHQYT